MSAPTITNRAFNALRQRFLHSTGISLGDDKRLLVEARLRERVASKANGSFNAYCEFLEHVDDGSEHQIVVDLLTTNETYFFREPKHFNVLAREVQSRFTTSSMRVWSAACSTGEEPYSIAMTLLDQRRHAPWEVHASDVSQRVLEQARRAVYPLQRLEHIPPGYLERFCLRGRDNFEGKFRVCEEVRNRVQFYQHNLRDTPQRNRFEVIFLRNVLIYFEPARKLELLHRVLSALAPGGLLFVGHAEPLNALPLPLQRVADAVFEKVA